MIRWTTPTFIVRLRNADDVDITEAKNVYFTVATRTATITKTGEDLEVGPQSVEVFLSQEESGRLHEGPAEIQLNWTYSDGRRAATVTKQIRIDKNLLREVVV